MLEKTEFVVSEKNLFPLMEVMLKEGKNVKFTVSGNSMWPLIINNRDSVILEQCDCTCLKKGDIILFKTSLEHYVLHRITKVKKGGYITTGDGNLHRDGFVPKKAVRAKARIIYRKDKKIDCKKWYWRFVFRIWMAAFPIRKLLMKTISKVSKFCRVRRRDS